MKRAAVTRETILLLEEIAANAVAPEVVQLVDGWVLRASTAAPFRRSNSVLPIRGDAHGLDDRIALVEEFYRRRGLPVRYQLSPVVAPPELERSLVARGYEVEATSLVQTADTSRVVAATAHAAALEVSVQDAVDEAWIATHADVHGASASERSRVATYGRLLGRLGPRGAAAAAGLPGDAAAGVGFVVLERGWAGIFGMATHPASRRQGVATAILRALARRAHAGGATQLYLQVEQGNDPALALYARAGFVPAYRYHYRRIEP